MSLPIRTGRLLLRRFRDEDLRDMLEFLDHPSVARATPEIEATEEGVLNYIAAQNSYELFEQDKCFDLAIERQIDGKVVGLLTLVRREHSLGEMGFALGIDFRNKGYATEAAEALVDYTFKELALHRIQAETTSDNVDSYKVMERLGMQPEGRLRETVLFEGQWLDTLYYGILAEEWRAQRG